MKQDLQNEMRTLCNSQPEVFKKGVLKKCNLCRTYCVHTSVMTIMSVHQVWDYQVCMKPCDTNRLVWMSGKRSMEMFGHNTCNSDVALFQVGPVIMRKALQGSNVCFGCKTLSKGTNVIIALERMNFDKQVTLSPILDPSVFSSRCLTFSGKQLWQADVNSFVHDRFVSSETENGIDKKEKIFMPFGKGGKKCVGYVSVLCGIREIYIRYTVHTAYCSSIIFTSTTFTRDNQLRPAHTMNLKNVQVCAGGERNARGASDNTSQGSDESPSVL